jgi:sugar lactone lactonase YvrE
MTHTIYRTPVSSAARRWINGLMILVFSMSLAACGGGGGDGGAATNGSGTGTSGATNTNPGSPAQATGNGFAVLADQDQTTPGGANITLTATGVQNNTQVEWVLSPDSPGTLTRTSGNRVEYAPPPPGTVTVNNIVNIIAINGDVTNNVTIVLSGNATAGSGTEGAEVVTPRSPGTNDTDDTGASDDPVASVPGIYLLAGNDFGAGMANGTGTSARFDTPTGIARDPQGNLYVVDRNNYVIRKITAQGVVTTLAGAPGTPGHADGNGAAARFSRLSDIAADNAGNLYVTDYGNAVIRKVTPDGTVSTLAGSPGISGSADGQGGAARFPGNPMSITVDASGNLYVAQTSSVRKITPTGVVTTIATAGFTDLNGIAVDATSNVYVSDGGFARSGRDSFRVSAAIRKVTPDGTVSTLAGTESTSTGTVHGYVDGPGAEARFRYPDGLTIDDEGNLFVGDRGNQAIRRITPDGIVSTVAGVPGQTGSEDGPIAEARFATPSGIVADANGTLYVTDSTHHTIRRIIPGTSVTTIAGAAPQSGSADGTRTTALFNKPDGITRDADGDIYVAEPASAIIRRIGRDGVVSTLAGSPGQTGVADGVGSAARFNLPRDVTTDASGNVIVSDFGNRLIRRITPAGVVSTYAGSLEGGRYEDGPAASARFIEPQAVAFDRSGNLYVADRTGETIRKITPDGIVSTFAGQPEGLVPNPVPFGSQPPADGPGSTAQFYFPHDIAVDNAGNIYVIDSGSLIRKITPQGVVSTFAGAAFQNGTRDGTGTAARFNFPQGLTTDDEGNVYVAEMRAIRKITPLGVVTTVAGYSDGAQSPLLGNVYRPSRLAMTGAKTLAFTSGNGVFELRLP